MNSLVGRTIVAVALCAGAACGPLPRPVESPIPTRVYGDAAGAEEIFILLPGIRDDMGSFETHGLIAQAAEILGPNSRFAFVAVDAHFGYYKEPSIHRRIRAEVAPRFAGRKLTLVGISLGGIGALMTARNDPARFHRLVLIAPFLGSRGNIQRLKEGAAPAPEDELEREVLAIWDWLGSDALKPPISLLYGLDDAFRPAYDYLAEKAPGISFQSAAGGHDWQTWKALWAQWLRRHRAQ